MRTFINRNEYAASGVARDRVLLEGVCCPRESVKFGC